LTNILVVVIEGFRLFIQALWSREYLVLGKTLHLHSSALFTSFQIQC